MLKARKFEFANIPKKCNLSDYREAISTIIKKYSKIDNLMSIYNWGSPSNPGISDMDIIFVFGNKNNHNNALPLSSRSFYFLKNRFRYLARHPFVFIDEDSFKSARYIYPNTNFNLLYGKNIKIKNLSSREDYYAEISLLNDIVIRHYPRDFLEQSVSARINVRDTLLRLNSLKYSIKAIEGITKGKNKEWSNKLNLIKKLRENWFKERDFDLLTSLNEEAVNISMEIVNKLRIFLIKNKLVKILSGDNIKYNGIKNKTFFLKDWNKEKALQEMSKLISDKKQFYSILPIELAAQLIEYSKYKGPISSYVRKNISNSLKYQLRHKKIIEKRIWVLNKQAELAFGLKHSDFAAFFDFGYRNKEGINNLILHFLDKLRYKRWRKNKI